MRISIIVAMDEVGTIGQNGELPWLQADDLREFARLTQGHHVIMGRLTWASLQPEGLPGRKLIVLTEHYTKSVEASGAIAKLSLTSAIDYAREQGETELFVAGGAEVYALAMAYVERLYLTRIHTTVKGLKRIKFPDMRQRNWQEVESRGPRAADEQNQYAYTFGVYDWNPRAFADNGAGRPKLERPTITCQLCERVVVCKYRLHNGRAPQKYCSVTCKNAAKKAHKVTAINPTGK
jgi:dihydrofolate reductase